MSKSWIYGSSVSQATGWYALPIGAGGQLTGLDIAPDSTKVCKTDVGGAYVWDTTLNPNKWRQLITVSSGMPFGGAWEVTIAPNNTNRIYLVNGSTCYRSDNLGSTWTTLSFPALVGNSANSGSATASNGVNKFTNQKFVVDPNNADVCYFATNNNGIQFSNDAGATASQVSGIAASTIGPGGAGICFDKNSGTITVSGQTRTATIYVPSYGHGIWQSTDGGQTWTQISDGAGLGGPTTVKTGQIDSVGVYYCADGSKTWMWRSSAWTEMKPGGSSFASSVVCVDPNSTGRLILSGPSGGKYGTESINSYTNSWHSTWAPNFPTGHPLALTATDIPWLRLEQFMTIGDMKIDPNTGLINFAEGTGYWTLNWPLTFVPFGWTSQSLGIEELVAQDVIAPVGAPPIVATEDRSVFVSPGFSIYPSTYYPTPTFCSGWSLDYASSDPTFLVALANDPGGSPQQRSASSSNSGSSWTVFPTQPATPGFGGAIAASTSTNFVFVGANNTLPYYTLDGGSTWTVCPGLPSTGWIPSLFTGATPIAADRVTTGIFYLYNSINGLYRSTDGGQTWTNILSSIFAGAAGNGVRLRATPGVAGDLWFVSGIVQGVSHPSATAKLWHATGCDTANPAVFSAIANITEPRHFGFGKAKPGGSGYPAIFMDGWLSGTYGIYRSDDGASTWSSLGTSANNNGDNISALNGDMNTYGRCYVGFSGTGFAYYTN